MKSPKAYLILKVMLETRRDAAQVQKEAKLHSIVDLQKERDLLEADDHKLARGDELSETQLEKDLDNEINREIVSLAGQPVAKLRREGNLLADPPRPAKPTFFPPRPPAVLSRYEREEKQAMESAAEQRREEMHLREGIAMARSAV